MESAKFSKDSIKVFHFHNGTGGGVLSVIRSFLLNRQHDKIENHVIYTINKKLIQNFQLPQLPRAASEQIFYYSPNWNFNYTCRELSKLLPDERAVIVGHDWLELGMVSLLGLINPVVHFLHGDYAYYYQLAQKHNQWIDVYATVAQSMANNLREKLASRSDDIYYVPFPVPKISSKIFLKKRGPLNLIYIGRPTQEKGYHLLPKIENELRGINVKAKWHIVGGIAQAEKSAWETQSEVVFYGQLPNENVIDLMHQMDCLVLPSLAEGTPVTVVEAMKVGLTCLVNDLKGGVQELLSNGVTGYLIKNNSVTSYAKILEELNRNKDILEKIGEAASTRANTYFDPNINTIRFEHLIQKYAVVKRKKRQRRKVYGSRLDGGWIPNFITNTIRSYLKF